MVQCEVALCEEEDVTTPLAVEVLEGVVVHEVVVVGFDTGYVE